MHVNFQSSFSNKLLSVDKKIVTASFGVDCEWPKEMILRGLREQVFILYLYLVFLSIY